MQFLTPQWLYLIPAILLLGLVWKKLEFYRPLNILRILRIAIIILFGCILAQPIIQKQKNHLDLWVLLDRSDSTEGLIAQKLPEWDKLLKENQNSKDSLRYIDYAAEVVEQVQHSETAIYTGNRKLTRTSLAIENVLALAAGDRPSRILLFTDGYATEPLHGLTEKLNQVGIPLDYRLVREATTNDYRVARIDLPSRVQVKEPFLLGITVRGHEDGKVPITIQRNNKVISPEKTEVELVNGIGKLEFSTRIINPGSYEFKAIIHPKEDAHSGNNQLNRWIEITSGPRVIIITKYQNDPLVATLRNQGIPVQTVMKPRDLKVGMLAGAKAVVINNVPAHEIPANFLASLNFYVRDQAGGLMMVGGKHSFGSGGYFESAIDPLLPVSMELKNDHRKLAVAMAIVMDRSGSMGMTVPAAGGKQITKMQLANNGAANAIKLLGQQDSIGVYATDSETETIVKQQQIRSNQKKLIQKAMRIQAGGGGIYVYTGLNDAWQRLKKVPIGTKHIILFSDASDTEEPGSYMKLIDEMNARDATISVIGLGTNKDSDAPLLEDIAKRGKGRIFFTQRAMDIPKLFAQETVTLARSAFIEEPIKTLASGHWSEISPTPIDWMQRVDGYNLSYAREDATTDLISQDEYSAPLIAHTHKGLGRTVAVTFPLGGKFSENVRNWNQYGDFVQTMTQWLMGDKLPPGIGLRHELNGTRLSIDLLYDTEEWANTFSQTPPQIKLIDGEHGNESYEIQWKRIAPGRFSLSHDLEEGAIIRGSILVGKHGIPFGPVSVGSSTEWAFDKERISELKAVSLLTGGRQLTDLSKAWIRPPMQHFADLRIPLAIALITLALIDALLTRTGWKLPEIKWFKNNHLKKTETAQLSTTPKTLESSPSFTKPQDRTTIAPLGRTSEESSSERQSRFTRAKKGRK